MDSVLEQARLLLETENVLSASWFAQTFQLSALDAVQYLQKLLASESELTASYLLCGQDKGGSVKYSVVPESSLSDEESILEVVFSKQIYSVQKRIDDRANLATCIVDACLQQADALLRQAQFNQPEQGGFLFNSCGAVSPPESLEIRAPGERILSSMNRSSTVRTTSLSSQSQPASTVAATAPITAKEEPASAPKPAAKPPAKPAGLSRNFFEAKAQPAAPVAKATPSTPSLPTFSAESHSSASTSPKSSLAEAAPQTRRLAKRRPASEDSEEEWEDDTAPVRTAHCGRATACAGAACASSSSAPLFRDGSTAEVDKEEEDSETEPESAGEGEEEGGEEREEAAGATRGKEGAPHRKKSKKNYATRGVMDDFVQDAVVAQHRQQLAAPAAVDPAGGRKKVKKLVEKLTTDEQGYFITEMVWEEVSEDEVDPALAARLDRENAPNLQVKPASRPLEKPKPAVAAKKGAPATQQKGMLAFFAKK